MLDGETTDLGTCSRRNGDMNDMDEKQIYKSALKRIVELDGELRNLFLNTGYFTGGESSKYFTKAVDIARTAISEGAMANVWKK